MGGSELLLTTHSPCTQLEQGAQDGSAFYIPRNVATTAKIKPMTLCSTAQCPNQRVTVAGYECEYNV